LNDVASSIDLVLKVLLQDQHFYDLWAGIPFVCSEMMKCFWS
jgi:hypothetical protein